MHYFLGSDGAAPIGDPFLIDGIQDGPRMRQRGVRPVGSEISAVARQETAFAAPLLSGHLGRSD
eukprot:6911126-Pyramimonas_sp.AAC.1